MAVQTYDPVKDLDIIIQLLGPNASFELDSVDVAGGATGSITIPAGATVRSISCWQTGTGAFLNVPTILVPAGVHITLPPNGGWTGSPNCIDAVTITLDMTANAVTDVGGITVEYVL